MKSMTGFGHSEYTDEHMRLTVEIKSYNNRYLDVFLYLPKDISHFEPRVRKFITSRARRGKIEIYCTLSLFSESKEVILDISAVSSYLDALKRLRKVSGIREQIRMSHLLRMDGVLKEIRHRDDDLLWSRLESTLAEAFAEFDGSRVTEGMDTRSDVESLIATVERELSSVEASAPVLSERIAANIRGKFEEVLGNEVDEARLLAETAALLVRFDINEELVRMRSHIGSFRQAIDAEEEVGKKLDFICQELNREINTIGAKNVLSEVDNPVLNMKHAVERIREQLRNVE